MRRFGGLLLAMAVLATACGGSSHASRPTTTRPTTAAAAGVAYTPVFSAAPCPADVQKLAPDARCGRLTVPDRRATRDGRMVRLFVTRFPSRTSPPAEPVLVLQGGPGETPQLTQFVDHPLRAGHDVYVLDERGTGRSLPSLACPEISNADYAILGEDLRATATHNAFVAAARACHDRLVREGIDLAAYNTAENAADVADLRVALHIPVWDLAGNSYGSRLALTVVRDHPQGVHAVGLSGVYPPGENIFTSVAGATAGAFDALFAAHAGLRATFVALVERLQRHPVTVSAALPNGRPLRVRFDGDHVVLITREALYQTALVPQVPALIQLLATGTGFDTVARLVAQEAPAELDAANFAWGQYFSVQCQEDVPRVDMHTVRADSVRYPSLDTVTVLVDNTPAVCALWNVGLQPESTRARVHTAVPVIGFTGALDPATPPPWLRALLPGLAHGYGYVLPGYGHDASAQPCPRDVRNAFFAHPNANPAQPCLTHPPAS